MISNPSGPSLRFTTVLALAHPFLGLHDTDLIAIGGVCAAVATIGLTGVTGWLVHRGKEQTKAMGDQVTAIRDTAEKELAAVNKQIKASIDANDAVREAARAQLQPLVFGYDVGRAVASPYHTDDLAQWRWRLRNEGTGPALDIEHGVLFDGLGDLLVMRQRTLRAGEELPDEDRFSNMYSVTVLKRPTHTTNRSQRLFVACPPSGS